MRFLCYGQRTAPAHWLLVAGWDLDGVHTGGRETTGEVTEQPDESWTGAVARKMGRRGSRQEAFWRHG